MAGREQVQPSRHNHSAADYDHARQNTAYRLAVEQARALLRTGSPSLALAVLDDVVSHAA